jgi:hypothetical protein
MAKRQLFFIPALLALFFVGSRFTGAQDDSTNIRVNVDLVQLNVAVTDNKGNYVSGLSPENFSITEDKNTGETCDLRRRQRGAPAGDSASAERTRRQNAAPR